jgi:hypothetical protein
MDLLLNLGPVVAFLVIHEIFRHLNPPWMAFAFMAAIFAVLWLDLLNVGLFHKFFPNVPSVLVPVVTEQASVRLRSRFRIKRSKRWLGLERKTNSTVCA